MKINIYDRITKGQRLKRVGITQRATGDYTASYQECGTFNITVHAAAKYSEELEVGRIINIGGSYWGIIENIKIQRGTVNSITVSGKELKSLLYRRVTVPLDMVPENAPAGFDSKKGATDALIKYFVANNLKADRREIENIMIPPDSDPPVGEKNDAYFTRFEVLGEVIEKLCRRRNLGWNVVADERTGTLMLNVYEGVDRTSRQSERPRCVFDLALGTVTAFEFTTETGEASNTFYCTRSGAEFEDEALTQTYYIDGEPAQGIERKEKHLNISIESDDDNMYESMEEQARKEMEGYRPVMTISCTTGKKLNQGIDYNLGDYVTFRSKPDNIEANRQITEIKTTVSAAAETTQVTIGDPRLTKFDFINKQIKNR